MYVHLLLCECFSLCNTLLQYLDEVTRDRTLRYSLAAESYGVALARFVARDVAAGS